MNRFGRISKPLPIMLLSLALACISGCATTTPIAKRDMSAFHAAAPRSILVVPLINRSLDVDAPNFVLAALPVPLAEKGFYVFPVNTTKYILEREGYYEGEKIHREPTPVLANLFGADAVLYVTVNRWDAQYVVFASTVTVSFDYRLVSKDGTELWKESKQMQYTPQNNNSGSPLAMLISAAITAAVARAAPNYMPLTRQANHDVFANGVNALPPGPYLTLGKVVN